MGTFEYVCLFFFFFSLASLQAGSILDMVIWSVCATVADIDFPWGKKGRKNIRLLCIEKRFQNYLVVNHENKDKASPGHKHKTQLTEVSKQDSSL